MIKKIYLTLFIFLATSNVFCSERQITICRKTEWDYENYTKYIHKRICGKQLLEISVTKRLENGKWNYECLIYDPETKRRVEYKGKKAKRIFERITKKFNQLPHKLEHNPANSLTKFD